MARAVLPFAPDVRRDSPIDRLAESTTLMAPALAILVFGVFLLFCVGFLPASAVHNGTHDTRHANGFPCH